MKEQLSEKERVVFDEEVAKINKSLPHPLSLSVNHAACKAIYNMASGIVDESGGGSVHDVDYYTFPSEALSNLILTSGTKAGSVDVKGYRFTDYVDWPYGRVDGSELHRNNEPVMLHLGFKKRESMNIFVIAENESVTPPQIGVDGYIILLTLAEFRRNAKYAHIGKVQNSLNDPVIPDFGSLNDLETPCELAFDNYSIRKSSPGGDYFEEGRRILYFDKAMVIEALSKVKWGEKVEVKGPGRAVHFLERDGYLEINQNNPVEVTLSVELSGIKNPQGATLNFESQPIGSSGGLSFRKSIFIPSGL
jgi:hypothetical protein